MKLLAKGFVYVLYTSSSLKNLKGSLSRKGSESSNRKGSNRIDVLYLSSSACTIKGNVLAGKTGNFRGDVLPVSTFYGYVGILWA